MGRGEPLLKTRYDFTFLTKEREEEDDPYSPTRARRRPE